MCEVDPWRGFMHGFSGRGGGATRKSLYFGQYLRDEVKHKNIDLYGRPCFGVAACYKYEYKGYNTAAFYTI